MEFIVGFSDTRCTQHELVGGKATNLGALTCAGFPVPKGFVVTDKSYDAFVHAGLSARIREHVASIDYGQADSVEAAARAIRELIVKADMPTAVQTEITAAYANFGEETFVAVRSSGTAEDLADLSFAGQHDTYLDMRGTAVVLDAVKRCWASLWTARAVAYRHEHGFDHFAVSLAVVIQEMVAADVAGVMFTANPLTARTDQIVVNASWGLGEGVVSGILNPDEFTLEKSSLDVAQTIIGSKSVRVVRDANRQAGVITEAVPPERQAEASLTQTQLNELGALGRQVETYYGGVPQDIEWALSGGKFYLLQARDITGVHFSWDEDVDAWQTLPDEQDVIWSRAYSDEFWTGAITPLFYSMRGRENTDGYRRACRVWGFSDLMRLRRFKYYKAEAYISTKMHKGFVTYTVPKQFRAGPSLNYFPPSMKVAAPSWPFSYLKYAWMHVRILRAPDQRLFNWMRVVQNYIDNRVAEADGLSEMERRRLSDNQLKAYIDSRIQLACDFMDPLHSGFMIYGAGALYLLGMMLAKWYDGSNTMIFSDLITGLPQRTITHKENLELWDIAEEIRKSPELMALFRSSEESKFFAALARNPAGRVVADKYAAFLKAHGHRGHADRDFWFKRRVEDPALDYRAVKALLSSTAGAARPDEREPKLIQAREAATADVADRLKRKPFGGLRVTLFKAVLNYCHKFLVVRDDERDYIDRVTFSKKLAFDELGIRLVERGVLDAKGDHYFLSEHEALGALSGIGAPRLLRAKVAGRKRDFESFHTKRSIPPAYLRAGREYREEEEASAQLEGARVMTGLGTSRGSCTGVARIVHELKDIGHIKAGEILITNSTDPGWTPVFVVISGLVLETGGMLAHGSCLAREYGLPAVMLPNATKRIEDGATITVDGETGRIQVVELDTVGEDRVALTS